MGELQKPKAKQNLNRPTPTAPAPSKSPPSLPLPQIKIESKPIEIFELEPITTPSISTSKPEPLIKQEKKELDWGDDDSMSFDAVSKLMNDTVPPVKHPSPPLVSKSVVQFDTQELEFVTDEQLLKSARTFHTSPTKDVDQTENANKEEHLKLFWFDAYEDQAAQPGRQKYRM